MELLVSATGTTIGALDLFMTFDFFVPVSGGGDVFDLLYTFSDTKTAAAGTSILSARPTKGMDLSH
jgi:hypothetical protein